MAWPMFHALQEDKDGFCNAVRNEVKATGMLDSAENCWDFFINKVRSCHCRHRRCCFCW